jgi:hypothetical protein
MALRKKAKRAASAENPEKGVPAMDKIAGLLALLATADMDTDDAAVKLGGVGFIDREISTLLGVSDGYVRQARFRAKGTKKARKKKGA